MRINFMLLIISFAFLTVVGLVTGEYLYNLKMAEQGLQQCVVAIGDTAYQAVWQKDCK